MTLQQPLRVAYLGPDGTYSHAAARSHFGQNVQFLPQESIPGVFDAVTNGRADRGIVPVENSIEGGVAFTLEALLETPLNLCGETYLDIEQCLLTPAPSLATIERVYSHPQGLAQCRHWLNQNLLRAALVPTLSTAQAARQVKDDPSSAAIASELAGTLFGVPLLVRAIQDRKPNVTRFTVLGKVAVAPTGSDKTSLVFSTPHSRGALCRALSIFDRQGLNLARIESRPRPGMPWEYIFFIDLEGHRDDPAVAHALTELDQLCEQVRVFGSYPRAR
jgi:chorismate mutase / prephenate dehydratase